MILQSLHRLLHFISSVFWVWHQTISVCEAPVLECEIVLSIHSPIDIAYVYMYLSNSITYNENHYSTSASQMLLNWLFFNDNPITFTITRNSFSDSITKYRNLTNIFLIVIMLTFTFFKFFFFYLSSLFSYFVCVVLLTSAGKNLLVTGKESCNNCNRSFT